MEDKKDFSGKRIIIRHLILAFNDRIYISKGLNAKECSDTCFPCLFHIYIHILGFGVLKRKSFIGMSHSKSSNRPNCETQWVANLHPVGSGEGKGGDHTAGGLYEEEGAGVR